jgi:hypothetical protein
MENPPRAGKILHDPESNDMTFDKSQTALIDIARLQNYT